MAPLAAQYKSDHSDSPLECYASQNGMRVTYLTVHWLQIMDSIGPQTSLRIIKLGSCEIAGSGAVYLVGLGHQSTSCLPFMFQSACMDG
jgi:hypothetical protein